GGEAALGPALAQPRPARVQRIRMGRRCSAPYSRRCQLLPTRQIPSPRAFTMAVNASRIWRSVRAAASNLSHYQAGAWTARPLAALVSPHRATRAAASRFETRRGAAQILFSGLLTY